VKAGSFGWVSDSHSVRVNGIRLAYRRFGAPQSAPVLLLHGLGETSANWDTIASALAVDRAVYALDLRGHGGSDRTDTYSLEGLRDDVIGFVTLLQLAPVELIGHSMGGVVGYLVAQEWPNAISKLVLEDVAPPLPANPPRPMPDRPDGPLDFDWAAVEAFNPERNAPPQRWWDRLTEITAPTLVLGGGLASFIPQDELAKLAERIPDARFRTIQAGHFIHRDEPAAFLAEVGEFLNG
jgi:pimeloyl-ACP methyl ester carboxylesterase